MRETFRRFKGWLICRPHQPVLVYEPCSTFINFINGSGPDWWVTPVWYCKRCKSILRIEYGLHEFYD